MQVSVVGSSRYRIRIFPRSREEEKGWKNKMDRERIVVSVHFAGTGRPAQAGVQCSPGVVDERQSTLSHGRFSERPADRRGWVMQCIVHSNLERRIPGWEGLLVSSFVGRYCTASM